MANTMDYNDTAGNFVTPKNKRIAAVKRTLATAVVDSPFVVPPSPLMKKLGCGTNVTVYRYVGFAFVPYIGMIRVCSAHRNV